MQSYTDAMLLEEQIGQVLMVGFPGTTPTPEVLELIQKQHIGNIILFARNIKDARQVRELTESLQLAARESGQRYPLLIAIDQENGMLQRFGGSATLFPGNMALGAIGSEQVAHAIAYATGEELKAMGINMNLAPVVDVNNNPANPVIGVRSFGENPHQVGKLAAATVKGYHDAGIITSLKHFPGHGDTTVDSHLALPSVPYTLERLEALELIPFKQGIEAGAESVMVAHLSLPALMHNAAIPSTLSREIVHDLLRERMGYTGVIISDCMEMNAVADTVGSEQGAVMALQAGMDLVLVSHRYKRQSGSIAAIKAALADGRLTSEQIQQSAEHVLALKAQALAWENHRAEKSLEIVNSAEHKQLRDATYALSTTLVRDEQHLIPVQLTHEQHIMILFAQQDSHTMAIDTYHYNHYLIEAVRQRHSKIETLTINRQPGEAEQQQFAQAITAADLVIIVTENANLDQFQQTLMQDVLHTSRPVIGLAVYNPYDLLAFPGLGTYLVTYEYTPPALEAAVRVIFGEILAKGHLPVSLPGLYQLKQ